MLTDNFQVLKVSVIFLPQRLQSIRKRICAAWAVAIIAISFLLSFPKRSQRAEFICRLTALAVVFSICAALSFLLTKDHCSTSQDLPRSTVSARVRRFFICVTIVHLLSTIAAIVYTAIVYAAKREAGLDSLLVSNLTHYAPHS
jgi:hypothetical protein